MVTIENKDLDAANVYPPHEVTSDDHYAELVESMESDGWVGRPILVLNVHGAMRALTGSHRIAAAAAVGIDVPCMVITADYALTKRIDRTVPDDLASVLVAALGEDHPAAQLAMQE